MIGFCKRYNHGVLDETECSECLSKNIVKLESCVHWEDDIYIEEYKRVIPVLKEYIELLDNYITRTSSVNAVHPFIASTQEEIDKGITLRGILRQFQILEDWGILK